jgi:quinol monooxygenase YgiN
MNVISTPDHNRSPGIGTSRRAFVASSLASGVALAVQPACAQNQIRSSQMEITIRQNAEVVTLINVFVVEPGNQDKVMQILKEGTENWFSKQPGYVSASFHKSNDGRRIVNYGQWRSPKDIEAFRSKPEFAAYVQPLMALAKGEAILCEASYVHHA